MSKELYKSGNYLVIDITGQVRKTVAIAGILNERGDDDTAFIVTGPPNGGTVPTINIKKADAENWTDAEGGGAPFTEASMLTFLRENTNFKPASGGSGAAPKKAFIGYVLQVGLNAPTIVPILNTFVAAPTLAYSGIGSYVVTTNVADNPQIIKMAKEEFTSNTTAKNLKMFVQNFGSLEVPIFALISLVEDTSGGDFGKYNSSDDLCDGVNSIIELYEY